MYTNTCTPVQICTITCTPIHVHQYMYTSTNLHHYMYTNTCTPVQIRTTLSQTSTTQSRHQIRTMLSPIPHQHQPVASCTLPTGLCHGCLVLAAPHVAQLLPSSSCIMRDQPSLMDGSATQWETKTAGKVLYAWDQVANESYGNFFYQNKLKQVTQWEVPGWGMCSLPPLQPWSTLYPGPGPVHTAQPIVSKSCVSVPTHETLDR